MRFVSVVVPDWLMATTSVSLMSGRSPKPDSSVASARLDAQIGAGRHRSQRGDEALPGDVRGALADGDHALDRA